MKYVWAKALADNIKRSGQLHKSQYARSGQIPQMSVLNKRLSYDLQLTLREESFQADNDAMNCYDRILDNVAVIASMRMGLSVKGGRFLKKQLCEFKHKILMNGRPSREQFCNQMKRRIHGTGQGTGWSPIIWTVVNDIIAEVMDHNQPGQVFRGPTCQEEARQTIDAYVDDSNLSVNEEGVLVFNTERGTDMNLEEASQLSYQKYARYLFMSGGRLALEKWKFYWITFRRKGFKYKFVNKQPKILLVREDYGDKMVQLKQLATCEAHKILGIRVSPDGDQAK